MVRRLFLVGVCAVCLSILPGTRERDVQAQGGALEVVVGGLDNPRGLAFGPEGALYVAQAGRGGDGTCVINGAGEEVCFGLTGKISRIWRGELDDVITGLPSLAAEGGNGASGPVDVTFQGRGNGFVVIGSSGPPDNRDLLGEDGALMGHVVRFTPNGRMEPIADIVHLEETINPHTTALDSNPYALAAGPHGIGVVDAGGNAAYEISASRRASLLAVFPDRIVTLPSGVMAPMQAVPNAITVGPDGAYYIGQLTGVPFPVGAARVYRVVPGEAPTIYAEGFTNIIDLAFGPDGSLYVLEFDANGIPTPPPASAITRIRPSGSRTTLPTPGLLLATGLAVDADGTLYVSAFGVVAGGGQVVRIPQ